MGRKKPEDITDQQRIFCREYLKDLNGTAAAVRAGYSARSARVTASKLLAKANIQKIIQELMDERSRRLEATSDMVLKELQVIAMGQVGLVENLKYSDKNRALSLLGQHLNLFRDQTLKEKLETVDHEAAPQVVLHLFENGSEAKPDKKEDDGSP